MLANSRRIEGEVSGYCPPICVIIVLAHPATFDILQCITIVLQIRLIGGYISPDWPLANAESPVPLPYKTSRVSQSLHNASYANFGTNAMLMHCKNFAFFKRLWNWTLSVSERPIWTRGYMISSIENKL